DPSRHVVAERAPPNNQRNRTKKRAPAVAAAVARAEARHADQPLDLSLLHCGDEHPRRFGEESRRLEDDFGPDRNAERLDDDIDSSQRALHGGDLEGVAGHFFQLGVVEANSPGGRGQRTHRMPRLEGGLHGLKADSSARADDQDYRHGVMLPVGPAWLTVMCDAGSRTARWAGGL